MEIEKGKRLKSILNKIETYSTNQSNYKEVENLLEKEIITEENTNTNSSYLENLKQVKDDLNKYKIVLKSKPKIGDLSKYEYTMYRFDLFVSHELRNHHHENKKE